MFRLIFHRMRMACIGWILLQLTKTRGKQKKETSALEEQIEAAKKGKKKQKALENKISKIDLLQALINDILAEPELDEELDDERPLMMMTMI